MPDADIATERVGPGTRLRVVDAILTGVHERGTSHYELLRAFADELTLRRRTKRSPRTDIARTSLAIRSW